MIQQYAKAGNLSCLLNTVQGSEIIPEPFRMQPKVVFKITYSEYINYVLSLTSEMGIRLMTDINVLSDMASTNQPYLYNCFLKDIAFAIIKELSFAERYMKKASVILPASMKSNNLVHVTHLLSLFDKCQEAQRELIMCCKTLGYTLPKEVSGVNANSFKLAVVLYYLYKQPHPVEEMNLVYDLI